MLIFGVTGEMPLARLGRRPWRAQSDGARGDRRWRSVARVIIQVSQASTTALPPTCAPLRDPGAVQPLVEIEHEPVGAQDLLPAKQ